MPAGTQSAFPIVTTGPGKPLDVGLISPDTGTTGWGGLLVNCPQLEYRRHIGHEHEVHLISPWFMVYVKQFSDTVWLDPDTDTPIAMSRTVRAINCLEIQNTIQKTGFLGCPTSCLGLSCQSGIHCENHPRGWKKGDWLISRQARNKLMITSPWWIGLETESVEESGSREFVLSPWGKNWLEMCLG